MKHPIQRTMRYSKSAAAGITASSNPNNVIDKAEYVNIWKPLSKTSITTTLNRVQTTGSIIENSHSKLSESISNFNDACFDGGDKKFIGNNTTDTLFDLMAENVSFDITAATTPNTAKNTNHHYNHRVPLQSSSSSQRKLLTANSSQDSLLMDSTGRIHDDDVITNEDYLKNEIGNLQYQLELERSRKHPQKLVSGSQFRMPLKVETLLKCASCDQYDRNSKKSKDNIRTLKLQIMRLEETLANSKKKGGDTLNTTPLTFDHQYGNNELAELIQQNTTLQNRVEELELDILKIKKQKCVNIIDDLKKELEESRTINQKDMQENKKKAAADQEIIRQLQRDKQNIELQMSRSKSVLVTHKQNCEKLEKKLDDSYKTIKELECKDNDSVYKTEIENYKKQLEVSFNTNKITATRLEETSNNFNALTIKHQALNSSHEDQAGRLRTARDELKTIAASVAISRQQIDELEYKLNVSEKDRVGTIGKFDELLVKYKLVCSDNESLKAEVASLTRAKETLTKRLIIEADNSKKTIEKSIASSVRLCVVAPTVNVHISDKRFNFKGGVAESALRTFITKEVLSKYSFLFKQRNEQDSPVEHEPLQSWVQRILSDMQKSIEDHVNSAILNST